METTFITVHDLSLDARIRYASESIEDILGYRPYEVKDKSCWEYFHPDEIPFARAIHGRGIQLDKAAVLNYCRIKHKDGSWVSCECVFTVVYDVLVASTSIYQSSLRSQQRAVKAPAIRRIFSSSPRDPRYHMLSYMSSKFTQSPQAMTHEPRAALFINRFTRTSTIMFATNGVSTIMGLQPDQLIGKSLYFCIAQNCLQDAVRCLESAKANDSIAYLRFWFRNPLIQEQRAAREASLLSEEDEDEGGVHLNSSEVRNQSNGTNGHSGPPVPPVTAPSGENDSGEDKSRSSSGNSGRIDGQSNDTIFDPPAVAAQSSTSSITPQDENDAGQGAIELEAVVSCTSDGLVVILRRAQPMPASDIDSPPLDYNNGIFASPWAPEPIVPDYAREAAPDAFGLPDTQAAKGPSTSDFMNSIREVAVFAWSLTGINGSLSQYSRGQPEAQALPPGGLPVWDPNSVTSDEKVNGFADNSHRRVVSDSDKDQMSMSSEDEIVYRRAPMMPPWRPVQRRARQEAFGTEEDEDGDARHGQSNARRRRLDE